MLTRDFDNYRVEPVCLFCQMPADIEHMCEGLGATFCLDCAKKLICAIVEECRYFDIGDGDLYPKTANHKRLPYRRMAKILKPYKEWLKKRGSRLTFDAFRHLIEDVHRLQFRFIKLDTDRIERIINAHVNVN